MERTERFHKIENLLANGRPATLAALVAQLEVSRATVKRDVAYMRERHKMPIVWDRDNGTYKFEKTPGNSGERVSLTGLWFSATEAHALLTMHQLLVGLDGGGLISDHVRPLIDRLEQMLGPSRAQADQVRHRVKVLSMAARKKSPEQFTVIAHALVDRKRIRIQHYSRQRRTTTDREVSPQRLVHYRDNWYLDAWCHMRRAVRSFALDAIRHASRIDTSAKEVASRTLDQLLGAGYGIFSGRSIRWAKLRFTPERAQWVADEIWHPGQKGRFLADGRYELSIPYSDDRELLMDILKHGADVEVAAPQALRERVAAVHRDAARRYEK